MMEYRITKYNPHNRVNGIYQVHEWTSFCDIGKKFNDGVLTYCQYRKTEQAYIDCCIELFREAHVSELMVCNPEYYDDKICFPHVLCDESDIKKIIMSCLQEKCWAKLEAKDFFIHFGYDYYMYIGTNLPRILVEKTAKQHNLFCESIPSPYRNQESSEA